MHSATPETGSTLPTLNPLATSFTPHSQAATAAAAILTSPTSDPPAVQPPSPRHRTTPPSLERFTRDFRELKSSLSSSNRGDNNNNNRKNDNNTLSRKIERLAEIHDQRRQLLSHMGTARAEMEQLEKEERRLRIEEGYVEADSLERLRELKGLREWAGDKWVGLGEEVGELEAEIAVPGG